MKAITTTLYVCGGLMGVAVILGAIDFKKAEKKGTMKNLYKEEKPITVSTSNNVHPVKEEKKIEVSDFSRGAISESIKQEHKKRIKKFSSKNFSRAAFPGEEIVPRTLTTTNKVQSTDSTQTLNQ